MNTFVCSYLAYFQAIGKNRIVYSISAVLNIVILPLFYLLGKAFGARGIWISFSLQFVIVVLYKMIMRVKDCSKERDPFAKYEYRKELDSLENIGIKIVKSFAEDVKYSFIYGVNFITITV